MNNNVLYYIIIFLCIISPNYYIGADEPLNNESSPNKTIILDLIPPHRATTKEALSDDQESELSIKYYLLNKSKFNSNKLLINAGNILNHSEYENIMKNKYPVKLINTPIIEAFLKNENNHYILSIINKISSTLIIESKGIPVTTFGKYGDWSVESQYYLPYDIGRIEPNSRKDIDITSSLLGLNKNAFKIKLSAIIYTSNGEYYCLETSYISF